MQYIIYNIHFKLCLRVDIALIYDVIRWEEKKILEAASRRGLSIKPIDAKNLVLDLSSSNINLADVVFQRCISYFRGLYLTAILESMNVKVINSFNVSMICGNKLLTTLKLKSCSIPTPKTIIALHPESALKALEIFNYYAVIKPIFGSWGRLVSLVKDFETAKSVIELKSELHNPLHEIFYIQEFVKRPPRDIRIVTVGLEPIAAEYRYSTNGEWRTNIARGGRAEKCDLTSELEDLACRVAEAMGGGVLGIDCMESDRGLLVHEVNANVEFKGVSEASGVDVAGRIVDYLAGLKR
ncbi:MAG: lysine biosynthesis protein LysX [Candidatus Methanomethylicia archaeon]